MPQLHLNLGELLQHREVKMEKFGVISWFAIKNASCGNTGYCGQEESCLRYLHLPADLNNMLEQYDQTENNSNLLSWIKDFGNKDNR
jgi:hypothetical protein